MLRKSFVSVIIRFRVKARENPFRFEMMHRTPGNPTTVNRMQQPAAMPWGLQNLKNVVCYCVLKLKIKRGNWQLSIIDY
jgi:hypothetical protein